MLWFLIPLVLLLLIASMRYGIEVEGRNVDLSLKLIVAGFRFKLHKPQDIKKSKAATTKPERSGFKILKSLQQGSGDVWREFGLDDIKRIWKIFKLLKRGFRLRVHRFDLTIATPDPALTGILYGSACAVRAVLPSHYVVRVQVDFTATAPSVIYRIEFSFIPLVLLYNTARAFAFVPFQKITRVFRKVRSHQRVKESMQHA